MKARIVVVLGILLLGVMPLSAAIYMKIEGIQGESTKPGHEGWIEVVSYSFGVNQAGAMAHGSGGGEGKASFHDISITKLLDKASPALMNASATGKHFPNVILEANGQRYQLQDVIITSDQRSAMGGGGTTTQEVIKMSFVRDVLHPDPPAPAAANRGAVTGALLPAVQQGPNATINGGNVMLQSLKLVGQTQAIIVVCDVAGGQAVAGLQRASQSRQTMPTVSIHANPKQPGQAGMSWTLNNAMVSGFSISGNCPQITLNFASYSGPAGGY